jgi:hypothetical protein
MGKEAGTGVQRAASMVNRDSSGRLCLARAASELLRFYSRGCLREEVTTASYRGSRYGHKGGARVRQRAVGPAARCVYGDDGVGWSARRAWTRGASKSFG